MYGPKDDDEHFKIFKDNVKKIAESNQKYDKGEEQTFTTIGQGADGDDASSDQKQQPEETPEQRKAREEKEAADRN